jgi:predicted permease
MRRLLNFCRNIVHRRRVDADLDEELASTFDQLVAERVAAGERPDAARRAAQRHLWSEASIKDHVRDVRAGSMFDAFLWDVRYGARLLRRNPVFALTATLSLAIGIGAVTSIFTVANGLLFRAAPGIADPDTLIDISKLERGQPMAGPFVAYRTFLDLRERMTTVDGLYVQQALPAAVTFGASGDTQRVFATIVSSTYFDLLRIRAAAGRLFAGSDFSEGSASRLAVLSYAFWMRQFRGDRAIVGDTIVLNGERFGVIGVAPEGFWGTSVVSADLWLLVGAVPVFGEVGDDRRFFTVRDADWGVLGGRLKAGVSRAQAAAELDAISAALEREYPNDYAGRSYLVAGASPIPPSIRIVLGGFFAVLLGLVSLVLVVACANVAGVLLARGAARRQEIAVRVAIGAGRTRLVRQLLTEALLLFLAGGFGGLAVARGMTALLLKLLPVFPVPVALSFPLDGRVLISAGVVTSAAAVLCGLAPAFHAAKADVLTGLKAGVQGPADRLRLRSAFVVAQVTFSIVLIVAAGVLGRAMTRAVSAAQQLDPNIASARVDLEAMGYSASTGPLVVRELAERLRWAPGAEAATLADQLPGQWMKIGPMEVPGVAPPGLSEAFAANWNVVDLGYFDTLRLGIVSGRDFTATDDAVAIVSESTARLLWPGESPIGKFIKWPATPAEPNATTFQVVGVAADATRARAPVVRERRTAAAGSASPVAVATAVVYVPLRQRYQPQLTILLRMADGERADRALAAVMGTLNANAPRPMSEPLAQDAVSPVQVQLRIAGAVAGSLGLVGLLLAGIGIYGVTAYTVARRTREIGIRVAMGATPATIVVMVLSQGMALVAAGAGIGLILSIAAGRLAKSVLFGAPSVDPLVYAGATLIFLVIGLAACSVPARRAIAIDAMEALRVE